MHRLFLLLGFILNIESCEYECEFENCKPTVDASICIWKVFWNNFTIVSHVCVTLLCNVFTFRIEVEIVPEFINSTIYVFTILADEKMTKCWAFLQNGSLNSELLLL